ncbi:hypothetical protein ElyMa_005048700 [Elysia marginata]|uniref:Uncharacterized protein n=1 Tax=Elysia marginata TaxID=1093978 RepID=A0AAV4JCX4_9GAST|nr:hypothetical protein ElyMa_005048700 [Elysia marginata]
MERYRETPDGSWERQRDIAKVGGWALIVFNHDSRHSVQRLLACLGPLVWRGLVGERGRGEASAAGQKTVAPADWRNSLMIPPLLPASPNQPEHSVHVHTPSHSNPALRLG